MDLKAPKERVKEESTTGFKFPNSQRGEYPYGVYRAPDEKGVYGIFIGKTAIYIGVSIDSIQERLKEHADGSSDQSSCINRRRPNKFLWEDASDYRGKTSFERARELISEYRPACNR